MTAVVSMATMEVEMAVEWKWVQTGSKEASQEVRQGLLLVQGLSRHQAGTDFGAQGGDTQCTSARWRVMNERALT